MYKKILSSLCALQHLELLDTISGSEGSLRSLQEADKVETIFILILRCCLPFLHSFFHRCVVVSRGYMACVDMIAAMILLFLNEFMNMQ